WGCLDNLGAVGNEARAECRCVDATCDGGVARVPETSKLYGILGSRDGPVNSVGGQCAGNTVAWICAAGAPIVVGDQIRAGDGRKVPLERYGTRAGQRPVCEERIIGAEEKAVSGIGIGTHKELQRAQQTRQRYLWRIQAVYEGRSSSRRRRKAA